MRKEKRLKEKVVDYASYQFSYQERIKYFIAGMTILIVISYLFYNSVFAIIIGSPFLIVFFSRCKKQCMKKRREELSMQFKDLLAALSSSLSTGYSVENAFREAYQEIVVLYGENAYLSKELSYIIHKISVNQTIEEALEEFSTRSRIEDIENFSQVLKIAKRSGGGLGIVLAATADTLQDKIEVRREIMTAIQAKRYEQKIMNMVPLAMIFYMRVSNGAFMGVLYENITGRIIMTVCLTLYILSYCLGEKIVDIKI